MKYEAKTRTVTFSADDVKAIEEIKKRLKIRTGTEAIRQAIHRTAKQLKDNLKGA